MLLAQPALGDSTGANENTVLIIPQTHWEGAVFKTREEYLQVGLPHILKALYLLKKYPQYHFVLDQMCYIQPFLERYPSEEADFRRFLQEGRLEIVGGTHTMNDNNMPSGESIARQYLLAKTYFRERLGYDVKTGWALDTFGHNAQMPQILKLTGMRSYWFMRGVTHADNPSEFLWQGIDGSRIQAFWLPLTSINEIPASPAEFNQVIRSQFDMLSLYNNHPERALLAGTDVSDPSEFVPKFIDQFNQSSPHLKARLAVPAEFEDLVEKRTDQTVVRGELNPVGQAIYSDRIELKQEMRRMEALLTDAEKLSVVASILGEPTDPKAIEQAWEPVLFNQEHDPAAGSVVDKVYTDELADYARARHLAEESTLHDLTSIARRTDTSGTGVPVMVFNSLSWKRTDVVEVDIPFSDPDVQAVVLSDPEGKSVPVQIEDAIRNEDGGIRQARVAFIARDIPALGFSIYHATSGVTPSESGPQAKSAPSPAAFSDSGYVDSGNAENALYQMSFDLRTAGITELVLKQAHWRVLKGSGNVVARETDGGDPWEIYGNLSGGWVSTQKSMPPPRAAYSQWSNDFIGFGEVISGPVFSEYFTPARPFGKNQFGTRVRLYNGLRRIDIRTQLTNQEAFVRYRALFPINLLHGTATYEIPFGALERPQEQEFPAQNWMDYSDGDKGIALLNRGIPGNGVIEGKLMLSLMRSSNLDRYPFPGKNEPGTGSDTGLGVGQTYTLDYSLVPHAGNWQAAKLWRDGMEFNYPLVARTASSHRGELPTKWGLLEVSKDDVVVSALKPTHGGVAIFRVYEAAGKPAEHVEVRFRDEIGKVSETNLIEQVGAKIPSDAHGFTFDLRPFEIKTFSIDLKPFSPAANELRH